MLGNGGECLHGDRCTSWDVQDGQRECGQAAVDADLLRCSPAVKRQGGGEGRRDGEGECGIVGVSASEAVRANLLRAREGLSEVEAATRLQRAGEGLRGSEETQGGEREGRRAEEGRPFIIFQRLCFRC